MPEASAAHNLREATRLLREAGYEIRNQKLVNAKTGEPMGGRVLLLDEPDLRALRRCLYKPSLERLGHRGERAHRRRCPV